MELGSTRTILDALGTALVCLLGVTLVHGQAGPEQRPLMAEEVFKNVQVLKGIPADQFMGTMGVFSAALGMSCEDCHAANDSKWENCPGQQPEKADGAAHGRHDGGPQQELL